MSNIIGIKDLVKGMVFGELTFKELVQDKNGEKWAICECKEGHLNYVKVRYLLRGEFKKCRYCQRYNISEDPFYRRAEKILKRCNDPKSNYYNDYGGRGIKCLLGNTPGEVAKNLKKIPGFKNGYVLDRIDVNGNYTLEHEKYGNNVYMDRYGFLCLGNLRWIPVLISNLNKRKSITLESLATKPRLRKDIIRSILLRKVIWKLSDFEFFYIGKKMYYAVHKDLPNYKNIIEEYRNKYTSTTIPEEEVKSQANGERNTNDLCN